MRPCQARSRVERRSVGVCSLAYRGLCLLPSAGASVRDRAVELGPGGFDSTSPHSALDGKGRTADRQGTGAGKPDKQDHTYTFTHSIHSLPPSLSYP